MVPFQKTSFHHHIFKIQMEKKNYKWDSNTECSFHQKSTVTWSLLENGLNWIFLGGKYRILKEGYTVLYQFSLYNPAQVFYSNKEALTCLLRLLLNLTVRPHLGQTSRGFWSGAGLLLDTLSTELLLAIPSTWSRGSDWFFISRLLFSRGQILQTDCWRERFNIISAFESNVSDLDPEPDPGA